MKKIFVALLAMGCLMAAPQAQGQTYYKQIHPNDISLSYGYSFLGGMIGSVVGKIDKFSEFFGDDIRVKSGGTKGVINLGYGYQLNKTISLGGAVGLNRMSVNLEDQAGKLTAASANIWMVMTTAKFDWFRTRSDIFGMYSKVGLGVMAIGGQLVEESTLSGTLWLPTGHLSLVGAEVGKGFSGFLEIGAGMQGVVQAGIRARF